MSNVNGATTEAATHAAPTSPKLVELLAAYSEAWQAMIKFTDPRDKAAKDAKLAVLKIEGEIKAEEAAIQKQANDAKIAEARNQRIALVRTLLDAHAALVTAPAKTSAADKQVLQTSFDTARETVENELLTKFAGSKPAKAATDGTTESNGRDTANKAAILELFLAGKTHKEIEDQGFARSTVWHTINNYKKANSVTA